jgi:transposase-like protein
MESTKVMLKCLCGKELFLEVIGGQYQNEYQSICPSCGREWLLIETSELENEGGDEDDGC